MHVANEGWDPESDLLWPSVILSYAPSVTVFLPFREPEREDASQVCRISDALRTLCIHTCAIADTSGPLLRCTLITRLRISAACRLRVFRFSTVSSGVRRSFCSRSSCALQEWIGVWYKMKVSTQCEATAQDVLEYAHAQGSPAKRTHASAQHSTVFREFCCRQGYVGAAGLWRLSPERGNIWRPFSFLTRSSKSSKHI